MSEEMLKIDRNENGVVTVTLNRPEIHNAFNDDLIARLSKTFIEIGNDETARLVILTGAGASFCAGADLNWMKAMVKYSQDENYKDSLKLANLFQTINSFTKPVIGKINGSALGGGAGLVAVCDYCLAVDTAKFGFTEVRLGLVPAVISPYVIAKIGESAARATFLSGEMFNAFYAKDIGLVHEVVSTHELDSCCEKVVTSFLKAGPKAAVTAKRLIKDVFGLVNRPDDLKDYTCRVIAGARISEEGQEGMGALLNKSKPSWSCK